MASLLIQNKAIMRVRRSSVRMIRDNAIAALLEQRFSAKEVLKRDAASVLLDLCRDGLADDEIGATLANAAPHMQPELIREIHALAAEIGIIVPDPA